MLIFRTHNLVHPLPHPLIIIKHHLRIIKVVSPLPILPQPRHLGELVASPKQILVIQIFLQLFFTQKPSVLRVESLACLLEFYDVGGLLLADVQQSHAVALQELETEWTRLGCVRILLGKIKLLGDQLCVNLRDESFFVELFFGKIGEVGQQSREVFGVDEVGVGIREEVKRVGVYFVVEFDSFWLGHFFDGF